MPTNDQDSSLTLVQAPSAPIRVLLLDDHPDNLLLRSTILRKYGYVTETASTVEEAENLLDEIDIAVLDYHLGAGKFGTDVATHLRERHPQVPIIILSATLERRFGGVEDMHLLKGYSSIDDLVTALRSFAASRWWWTRATSSTRGSTWPWATMWCWRFWTVMGPGST
jgi:two-component system, OmpR family, response regulator